KVSVYDHGLLYGDGVFEGLRIYNGKVFRIHEHLERLYDSARHIYLEIPIPRAEMLKAIEHTVQANKKRNGYIRLVVTRGAGSLEGVTRNSILEIAHGLEIPVQEMVLTRHDVYTADECFLTGTAAEVIPVIKCDSRTIGNGKPGSITRQLRERFHELVRE